MLKVDELYPPLEKQEQDGVHQVKDRGGIWIDCEKEADALALSRVPLLEAEACCETNFGKGYVSQFEAAAKLLRKYRMSDMARWFEGRAEYFRQHEPEPW